MDRSRRSMGLVVVGIVCWLALLCSVVEAEEPWPVWSDRMYDTCMSMRKEFSGKSSRLATICDNLQEVVEEELKMLAINTGAALDKKEAFENLDFTYDLTDRLELEPYRSDGDMILTKTARHFITNDIVSAKEMKMVFFKNAAQWLMNAAVDNGKSIRVMKPYPNMDDLERRMHKDDL